MKKLIFIFLLFIGCNTAVEIEESCEEIPPVILNHYDNGHLEYYVYSEGVLCFED